MHQEALLTQAHILTEKHEALASATGQNFNLFKILGRETDEVRTHSAILAELLDPKGSHGQGAVFARLFASRFGIRTEGIEFASVECERPIGEGSRADILMKMNGTCVIVENKIHAGDQPRQLERYHNYAAGWDNHKLLYLTLHGDPPSENSLGELPLQKVKRISYERDVIAWLDDCIKEVARVPQIREILAHYQELLRKLTGMSKGELIMDLQELLEKKQGDTYNFELVSEIAKAMTAFSVKTEWAFWQTLKERLQVTGTGSWRLKPLGENEARCFKEVDEGIIRHAHGSGNKKWGYGWTFRIESNANSKRYSWEVGEVLLRIQCDGNRPYYGFIAVEPTPEGLRWLPCDGGERQPYRNWGEWLSKQEEAWYTDDKWWLAWGYSRQSVNLRKSGWLASDAMRQLVEDEAVGQLVDTIHDTISLLEACEAPWDSDAGA